MISGKTGRLAWSVSTNSFQFKWPYNGSQNAALHLRHHPRWGKDVFLSFERGQFNCRLDDCRVMVRFDDGKPMAFSAVEPDDHSTTVLFISDYDRFVGALRKAKKVAIEASVYQNGNPVFEFNVAGLEWR